FTTEIGKQQAASVKLQEAQKALAADRVVEAEKILLQVIAVDPHNVGAYRGLGEVYRRQKNYDQAKEVFEFLLKLNDKDPLAYLGLADLAEAKGDLLTASQEYHRVLTLDTANVPSYLALAKTYQAMGQTNEAQEVIKQGLEVEPRNVVLLDFLIEISIILQDQPEAIKAWEKLQIVNPDNQKLSELREQIDDL
ncbi:MAG: tetratricopeptide repeat protein, partial [Candidatus Komeilibacteria bacterium]|nr:tetratricopeptide repeat protein [Candidatus Komeilibacteria bacterium]